MHPSLRSLFAALSFVCVAQVGAAAGFQAGALSVDISPTGFPVRVNAMFTERSASKVAEPLYARALALYDGTNRLVLCVVDTCMVPRDLIDAAKESARQATGLATSRMLVSATHTHSAPSAMGCLGSRVDPAYAAWLPGRIAAAITGAVARLAPARVGWAQGDDWEHTFNRRWVRRPDRLLTDPFGQRNVRAHMHPGHESPDAVGPSGPVDPQLSVLAVQDANGRPLALLANYSMHYYGSPLLSADYYGRFHEHVRGLLGAGPEFVGLMSQGTSGDLMWMDYGAPRREIGYDAYAKELAQRVADLVRGLAWRASAPIQIAERTLDLGYRAPDEARLAWARGMAAKLGDKLPQSQPEIYALEALHLHERPRTELKVQAVRIGELGITALPNEVFAITGLKLKRQSPLAATFNIELANGAEGYIPPPEQHKLGGYTTWPARTAGLETNAEPRLVEAALSLLEEVAGRSRRPLVDEHGAYARAVLAAKPSAYWRLEDMVAPAVLDATGQHAAVHEDGVALYLPGADGRRGHQPPQPPATNAFSGARINRAAHFAGGRLRTTVPLGESYSIELWLWNGLPDTTRAVTGYFFSRGADGDKQARGEHLGIGGTYRPGHAGRLMLFNGNERNDVLVGRTVLALRAWHHVVLVRDGARVRVHLDGRAEPEMAGEFAADVPAGARGLFFGGRNDNLYNFEGKLDEVAVYARALGAEEIAAHYQASGLKGPVTASAAASVPPPLSPEESLRKIHLRPGFRAELVASEPLVLDPVAIDWAPDGRLWVVEMADYPLGMDGQGRAGGRVRVLEDTNGDGRYDKAAIFADGLSFPTGLLTWRDGVLVTAAPDIIFLRDTNGDGRADVREVLVSGLTTGNQQLRANGLRWGLDGWVYCAAGGHYLGYGAGTKLKTKRGETLVGSRDFRFRPDTGEIEPVSGPSQFGRNRDDWGRWFGTQNSRPLWHYVLEDRYLRRNPHYAAPDPTRQIVVPLNPKVWPVSAPEKRFHSFENAGHFTSACAGMIYRDELLFGPAGGGGESHAFTCEPFHNLVQRNVIVPDGVSFAARRAPGEEQADFFASEDRWCRPVMTRTGPDGALWVVDMYRAMIEHPDWLPKEGREELLPQYRLGDDRGRIYRVFAEGRPPRQPARLDRLNTVELVAALDSPNEWQRDKAHMMLVWRADNSAAPALAKLAGAVNPLARVHALQTLHQLGELSDALLMQALRDEHPGVRENALQLAESRTNAGVIAAGVKLADDRDAKVRLQLACTLGAWTNASAGDALARLAVADHENPYMLAAIMSSAVPHARALGAAAATAPASARATLSEPLAALALALNDRGLLAVLMAPVFKADGIPTEAQFIAATRLLDTLARKNVTLASLASGDDALAGALRDVGWNTPQSIFASARSVVANDDMAISMRAAAAGVVARDEVDRAAALRLLGGLLEPKVAPEVQRAAIAGLAASGEASVPALLLGRLSSFSPASRGTAVEALLSREAWAFTLTEQLRDTSSVTLDAAQRARLLKHSSKRVRDLAATVFAAGGARSEVVERYRSALKLAGDSTRGRAVFSRLCVACHKVGNEGQQVGPDLQSVAGHPPDKLLANILDPSADVQPGYGAYQCELSDGTEVYGLIAVETGNSVTIKLPDGTARVVLRKDIKSLRGLNASLMPEGLEAALTPQDMADLIGFLRGGLNAGK